MSAAVRTALVSALAAAFEESETVIAGPFHGFVPAGTDASLPALVVAQQSSLDSHTLAAPAFEQLTLLVKVVGRTGSAAALAEVYEQAHTALVGQLHELESGELADCRRIERIEYHEADAAAASWWHVGGLYRLTVRNT